MDFLIPVAQAAAKAPEHSPVAGFGMMNILFLVVIVAFFYFAIIRPQSKRTKEHKQMLAQLARGDEIITNGGVAGRVDDVGESFITVEIAANVKVKLQKQAISQVLPKGTLKSA